MFWGITLECGKKYTQVLQKSFCVTMAALGFENPSNDHVYVVAEVNNAHHVLCCLQSGKIPQQTLNLNFTEGELVSFFIEGEGEVHLTGYLIQENNDSDLSDDSSDEENETEEMNGTVEAENIISNSHQSNHMQTNGISETKGKHSTETVSEVSWQGILSAHHEKDVSDGEIEEDKQIDVGKQNVDEIQLEESNVYNGSIFPTSPTNNAGMSPVKTATNEKGNREDHSNETQTVESTDSNLNNSVNISSNEISDDVSSAAASAKGKTNDNSNNIASCGTLTSSDNLTSTESSDQSDFTLSGENDEEVETAHLENNRRRTIKRTRKQILPKTEDEKQTKTRHSKRIKISDNPEKKAPSSKAEKNASSSKAEKNAPSSKAEKNAPNSKAEKKASTKGEKKPSTKTEKKQSIKTEKKLNDKKAPASKSDKKLKSAKSDKKSVISKAILVKC